MVSDSRPPSSASAIAALSTRSLVSERRFFALTVDKPYVVRCTYAVSIQRKFRGERDDDDDPVGSGTQATGGRLLGRDDGRRFRSDRPRDQGSFAAVHGPRTRGLRD